MAAAKVTPRRRRQGAVWYPNDLLPPRQFGSNRGREAVAELRRIGEDVLAAVTSIGLRIEPEVRHRRASKEVKNDAARPKVKPAHWMKARFALNVCCSPLPKSSVLIPTAM